MKAQGDASRACGTPPTSWPGHPATDGVLNGLDSIVLAKLMGHSSTKMLEKVYAKHARRDDFMTEQLNRAVAGV